MAVLLCGLLTPATAQQVPPEPQSPVQTQMPAPAPASVPAAPAVTPSAIASPPQAGNGAGGDDGLVPPMSAADGAAPSVVPSAETFSLTGGEAVPEPGFDVGAASPAEEDTSISAQLPHDLSPWGMFMAADWVVKAVMIGLAFASVVTWTVWLVKTFELLFVQRRLRVALRGFLGSASLDEARRVAPSGPAGAMLRASDLEIMRSGDLPAEGIKERVSISLGRIEVAAGRAITRGTGLLATIGATAPFVGLFGTVWGIMNAFIGISKAQTTNLAVVAPGIAEALLATAIGLVAAIPAVVIYNHFSRQVSGYRVLMGDAAAEVLRLLSRDLDRRDANHTRHPPARLRAAAE